MPTIQSSTHVLLLLRWLSLTYSQILTLSLENLKLLLNANKTKVMVFSSGGTKAQPFPISTLNGISIEFVDSYKYLGFWLDKKLNFKHHIECLAMKLKFTLSFLYRLKSCFSMSSRKTLVAGLFLPHTVYRFACPSALAKLNPLYHSALRYITDSNYRTHHCVLYNLVDWPSLAMHRMQNWYIFIYKAILRKPPSYINSKFLFLQGSHSLRSQAWLHCAVPAV